jgi:hypothetical protein
MTEARRYRGFDPYGVAIGPFHPCPFTKEKSRPGVTPSGFLMRLPVRHCSGSVASMGKADAVWLTKDYRVCSDDLMLQALERNKSSRSRFE